LVDTRRFDDEQLLDHLVRRAEHQVLADVLRIVVLLALDRLIGHGLGKTVLHGAGILHEVLESAAIIHAVLHGLFPAVRPVVDAGAPLHHETRARHLRMVGHGLVELVGEHLNFGGGC
jgi:hypothetical protein